MSIWRRIKYKDTALENQVDDIWDRITDLELEMEMLKDYLGVEKGFKKVEGEDK